MEQNHMLNPAHHRDSTTTTGHNPQHGESDKHAHHGRNHSLGRDSILGPLPPLPSSPLHSQLPVQHPAQHQSQHQSQHQQRFQQLPHPDPQQRQQIPDTSPPAYSSHSLHLPDISSPNDAPLSRPRLSHDHEQTLPSLSSVTAAHDLRGDAMLNHQSQPLPPWPGSLPPSAPAYFAPIPPALQRMASPSIMDLDMASPTAISSILSPTSPSQHSEGRSRSVNLDDPDVRLAAEALGDLRADFLSSPPSSQAVLPMSPPTQSVSSNSPRSQSPTGPEPLLSLLTTAHPLFKTTIGGATSAYGGAKNFSPRFKSGAEYVEGYLGPLANTVGTVSRATGVEGSVRWFLGGNRRSNSDHAGNSKKRRKVDNGDESSKGINVNRDESALEGEISDSFPSTPKGDRRLSTASTVDTLPAYDDARSPAYTELVETPKKTVSASMPNAAWQQRLIMSTSGLSIAMSEESLRSLKYCLRWLKWANEHIGRIIDALKGTLEQYDSATQMESDYESNGSSERSALGHVRMSEESRQELITRINSLKGDVLKTLQDVVNTVSKYAGGALPENAKVLVRRHLTSLPQRFRVATMADKDAEGNSKEGEPAMREGAQKMLVLAKEGLDMVTQISGVLDGTIVSAEDWCDRMGKRRRRSEKDEEVPLLPRTNADIKML